MRPISISRSSRVTLIIALLFNLNACKPATEPPPDILKSQRESLNKAKALEAQMQQQSQQRIQAVDAAPPAEP